MVGRKRPRLPSSGTSLDEEDYLRTVEGYEEGDTKPLPVPIVDVDSPSPKKRPAGPLKEGLGGNSPRTPSAVLGAESTAAFSRNLRSVVALVPAAVGPTPRTPEMPTLSSQSRAPSRSSSRSAREVPVNDASEVGETEPPDGACSFPLHLVSNGLIWHVMDFLDHQGHLRIGNGELDGIAQMSPACWDNRYALPVIALTIQTLAIAPTLSITLRRWAKRLNLVFPGVPRGRLPNRRLLRPWDVPSVWPYGLWGLASRVVSKFLGRKKPPMEAHFIADLSDLATRAGHELWVIATMVSTLFVVLDSPWFWHVLLGFGNPAE